MGQMGQTPARLVYSPKVWAFTKDAKGNLYDVSPYIVSGEVVRNINQVSTASLTLRNPKKVFTSPKKGIPFHPQDPITIYMERLAGFPVRVFTGYLDQTPYYQLQPGVIQLSASCTLKRLLYTYFDPSLPYMISFFTKYGWINTGQGSIISASSFDTPTIGSTHKGTLQDGNITKLLWAILYDIGEWNNPEIYIEPLPTGADGIINTVRRLMISIDENNKLSSELFEQFLDMTIGTQSEGGSPGVVDLTSNAPNAQKAYNFFLTQGLSGYAAAGIVGNFQQESTPDVNPEAGSAPSSYGIAQWGTSGGRYYNLVAFAKGLPGNPAPSTLRAQLQFCWHELNTVEQYKTVLDKLKNATSAAEAATIFCGQGTPASGGYENPGKPYLDKRIAYANDLYKQFGDGTTITTSSNSKTGKTVTKKVTLNSDLTSKGLSAIKNDIAANVPDDAYTAIVEAANALADSGLPYPSPDAHFGSLAKIWDGGYDCSGSVSYVLYAAGFISANGAFATGGEEPVLTAAGIKPGVGPSGSKSVTIWVNPGVHTFMRIGGKNGRYWGTTDGSVTSKQGAGAWLSQGSATPSNVSDSSFISYHIPSALLKKPATYRGPLPIGGTNIPATGQGGGDSIASQDSSTISKASAEAFAQQLDFPTAEDSVVAILLGSEGKGLMHDQALMPFVQQIAQSCMRSFMSLPDGSFYAFFPDYFGEFGQHNPYWNIDDIEITNGTIYLTDDALATHVFAIGDTEFWGIGNTSSDTQLMNELFSTGTVTVYNAFVSDDITDHSKKPGAMSYLMSTNEAIDFVKRFGARPLVQEYPMVRSNIFEMLMAYQLFMTAWSNQFISTFNFTFMPELFPGGKVGFPTHDLMMYINQVTHTFDYTDGFETTAQLSAPALIPNIKESKLLPPNMISAMAEPVQKDNKPISDTGQQTTKPKKSTKAHKPKHTKPSTASLENDRSVALPTLLG